MADDKGPLYVNNRDSIDLDRMLNEWRGGRFGRREEDDFRRTTDNRKTEVVFLLENLYNWMPGKAQVLQRDSSSLIQEVFPTGFVSGGRTDRFGIRVQYNGQESIKYVPFQSTADEFAAACGFGSDVEVVWGGIETTVNLVTTMAYYYRWLVRFHGNNGGLSGELVAGSPDLFDECLVTRYQWWPSSRLIEVNQFFPMPRYPSFAPMHSPARIVWDESQSRWEISRNGTPDEGEVFYAAWSGSSGWLGLANYSFYVPGRRGEYVTAVNDGDDWYLSSGGEPVGETPSSLLQQSVWFVWERGAWRQFYGSNYFNLFVKYSGGSFGWGVDGPFTIDAFDTGTDGSRVVPAGMIAQAHWTGREWSIGQVERRNYRFVMPEF